MYTYLYLHLSVYVIYICIDIYTYIYIYLCIYMNIFIFLYIHVYLCTTGPKSSGRAEKQRRAKSHCAEPRFSPGEGRVCKREGEGESV